jgi:diketogulonate reductase-like aldo/keto reductase
MSTETLPVGHCCAYERHSSIDRHFFSEDLVGQALVELQTKYEISRQDLFIQTKFTSINGQDQSQALPYDPRLPLRDQVRQSFTKSLENLKTDYVDSLVLHGPERTHQQTMEIYRECETFVDEGRVKQLGISNLYDLNGLKRLYDDARHKPAVLQNRFHAETQFDSDLREFCREKNIFYQSFWTLTGRKRSTHVVIYVSCCSSS